MNYQPKWISVNIERRQHDSALINRESIVHIRTCVREFTKSEHSHYKCFILNDTMLMCFLCLIKIDSHTYTKALWTSRSVRGRTNVCNILHTSGNATQSKFHRPRIFFTFVSFCFCLLLSNCVRIVSYSIVQRLSWTIHQYIVGNVL